ncbi:MAG: hypothetical protein C0410_06640 [Anaerolinea sp.]|nr:hypothetical protein [Anaerolinea sp.]
MNNIISEDLGQIAECAIRKLMENFNKQEVDGYFFGQKALAKLPRFTEISQLRLPGGQGEFDAVGRTENDKLWIVEVKWRKRRTGIKEIKKQIQRAEKIIKIDRKNVIYWFISKSGFTIEAKSFVLTNQILHTDERALLELFKLLGADCTNLVRSS